MWPTISSLSQVAMRPPRAARVRRLALEYLEARSLLSFADFELSSLLPANGGDGSKGFVVDGIIDQGKLGYIYRNYQPLGDLNQDGIDDFLLGAGGTTAVAGQAYLIFGRSGGFPDGIDLQTLDGTNGYRIDAMTVYDGTGVNGSGIGDVNHDGFPDLALGAIRADPSPDRADAGQTFVLYGGPAHLAALDLADGAPTAGSRSSSLDGTHGFTINGTVAGEGTGYVIDAAGDLNGDHVDDMVIQKSYFPFPERSMWYSDVTPVQETSFPATVELASLNGANGFMIPGFGPNNAYSSRSERRRRRQR